MIETRLNSELPIGYKKALQNNIRNPCYILSEREYKNCPLCWLTSEGYMENMGKGDKSVEKRYYTFCKHRYFCKTVMDYFCDTVERDKDGR